MLIKRLNRRGAIMCKCAVFQRLPHGSCFSSRLLTNALISADSLRRGMCEWETRAMKSSLSALPPLERVREFKGTLGNFSTKRNGNARRTFPTDDSALRTFTFISRALFFFQVLLSVRIIWAEMRNTLIRAILKIIAAFPNRPWQIPDARFRRRSETPEVARRYIRSLVWNIR